MSIRSFFTSAARAAVKSVKVAAVQLSNLEENRDEVLSLVKAAMDANGAVMVKGYGLTLDVVAMAKKLAKGIDMDQEVGIMVGAAIRLNEIARGKGEEGEEAGCCAGGDCVDCRKDEEGAAYPIDCGTSERLDGLSKGRWEKAGERRKAIEEAANLYSVVFGLALEHNIDCKIVQTVDGVAKAGRYVAHKLQAVDRWKADNLRNQIDRLMLVLNGKEHKDASINLW